MTAVVDTSWWMRLAEDPARPTAARVKALHPRLAARHELFAPELVNYELLHVIHRQDPGAVGGDLARRQHFAAQLLEGIEFVSAAPGDRCLIGQLAEEHRLSGYDAAFLALAATIPDAILVTLDKGLAKAADAVLGSGRALDVDGVERHLGADPARHVA